MSFSLELRAAIGAFCALALPAGAPPVVFGAPVSSAVKKPATEAAARSAAPATYGAWRSCKMGGGGYIQNVVACPSNPRRLYTYVDVGGLSRSDDGGQNWRMLHGALPAREGNYQVRGLLVDPRDDRRVLIATGSQWGQMEGVYLSRDAGASWRKTLSAQFAGNGPDRWTGFVLARHPRDPNVVVAASEGTGVFRSGDGGQNWRKLGLEGVHPTDVRFDRSDPNRLWLCAQPFSGWMGGKEQTLKGGFFRSEDGGGSWRKLSEAGPSELLQDPRDASRLLGLRDSRPLLSRDRGATWRDFSEGLPREEKPGDLSESKFQALAAGPDFVLTASTRGTFYRLPSGQARWQKIERQGIEEIYEGEEWFRHKGGGFGSALGSITVHPRDPNHWFFTDWYAIYQSFDAGKNWKLTINGIEVTVLHALTQDPSDPGVVHLGMADNGYFYSENGGERFHNVDWHSGISNNIKSITLSPALPNRLYAVGPQTWEWEANQVFVSIDRGRTWTRSPMTGLPDLAKEKRTCNTIAVDPRNPYLVYLAVSGNLAPGKGGLYRSTDGGKSWRWFGEGLPASDRFFRESIWDQGREIAVSPDGSVVLISRERSEAYRRAAGAGQAANGKWTLVRAGGGTYYCVVADNLTPGRFFLGLRGGGLFRSDDGGANWRKVRDEAGYVAVDERVRGRVAAGTDDGVALSTDGGQTWRTLDKHLPYRVNNIVAFAGERLITGSAGNGAFWMPLSTQGARPVRARPATLARVPGSRADLPQIINGDMARGAGQPAGWTNLWTGEGNLEAVRDTANYKGAPASLQLRSVRGAAYGTVGQSLAPVAGGFTVSGAARSRGDLKEALVAVQAMGAAGKQLEWITLFDARDGKDWKEFSAQVSLPPQTARWNLLLTLRGDGAVWLDEVKLQAASAVFPQ